MKYLSFGLAAILLIGMVMPAVSQGPPPLFGETWIFTAGPANFLHETPVVVPLGTIPPNSDYHAVMTSRLTWNDPAGDRVDHLFGLSIELHAFDINGVDLTSWDADLFFAQDRRYLTRAGDHYDQAIIQQAIIHPPAGMATLRLVILEQSSTGIILPVLEEVRVVFTAVTLNL